MLDQVLAFKKPWDYVSGRGKGAVPCRLIHLSMCLWCKGFKNLMFKHHWVNTSSNVSYLNCS